MYSATLGWHISIYLLGSFSEKYGSSPFICWFPVCRIYLFLKVGYTPAAVLQERVLFIHWLFLFLFYEIHRYHGSIFNISLSFTYKSCQVTEKLKVEEGAHSIKEIFLWHFFNTYEINNTWLIYLEHIQLYMYLKMQMQAHFIHNGNTKEHKNNHLKNWILYSPLKSMR